MANGVGDYGRKKGCLWYKVLAARYGEDGGTIGDRGRISSVWWRNLISIKRGDREGDGIWFNYHLHIGRWRMVYALYFGWILGLTKVL